MIRINLDRGSGPGNGRLGLIEKSRTLLESGGPASAAIVTAAA